MGGNNIGFVWLNKKVANKYVCDELCSPEFLSYCLGQIKGVERQGMIDSICPGHRI